jgi:UDP-2,3-diacylglucosamine hydrolase
VTTWFLSDLHLRDSFERNGYTLLRFLFELNKNPSENRLILLGDIFDIWVSDWSVYSKKFQLIVDEIAKLKKGGGEVLYFEGNHDVHLAKFWTEKFAIPVYQSAQTFGFDGLKIRVEHGDYINPDDTAYMKWLAAMRGPFLTFLAHHIPGNVWDWLAEKYTKKFTSRKRYRYTPEHAEKIRNMIRAYAEKAFATGAFDLIVTGHMHVLDDYKFRVGTQDARSINLGTWLDKPRVLKVSQSDVQIVEL